MESGDCDSSESTSLRDGLKRLERRRRVRGGMLLGHWIFRRKVEFEGSEHGSIGEENVAEFLIEKEELMRRLEQIRADRVLRHRGMERNQFRLGTGVSPAVYAATHSEFGSGVRRARVAPLRERQQDWLFEQVAAFARSAAGALRREEKDIPHLSGGDLVQSLPLRREWIVLVHGVLFET